MSITLKELILAVQERKLTKEQLEDLYSEMSTLYAKYQLRLADIRKKKAVYFVEKREKTIALTESNWQATEEGLKEIDYSHSSKAVEKMLSSVKNRIYNLL